MRREEFYNFNRPSVVKQCIVCEKTSRGTMRVVQNHGGNISTYK